MPCAFAAFAVTASVAGAGARVIDSTASLTADSLDQPRKSRPPIITCGV